jgi:hypothetical protein
VANASISDSTKFGTTLAVQAGPMQVVAVGDVNGNVLETTDNGDGTSTLVVTGVSVSSGVAQGSTTAGQTGPLMQAAVTTNDPSYTTGQTSPFSLTVAGGLRTFAKAYRDSIITAQGSGTQTAPTAATVIATVTPGTAGLWEVTVTLSISGVSAVAVESNNMGLYQTATARLAPIVYAATTAGTPQPVTTGPIILNLSAVDTVNVKAIANATATTPVYAAQIICRRVG